MEEKDRKFHPNMASSQSLVAIYFDHRALLDCKGSLFAALSKHHKPSIWCLPYNPALGEVVSSVSEPF